MSATPTATAARPKKRPATRKAAERAVTAPKTAPGQLPPPFTFDPESVEANRRFMALSPAERKQRIREGFAELRQAFGEMTFDQWLEEHHRLEDGGHED